MVHGTIFIARNGIGTAVGWRNNHVSMHPMDFEEFLWAHGYGENAIGILRESFSICTAVETAVNDRFQSLFREYLAIGGMPKAFRLTRRGTPSTRRRGKDVGGDIPEPMRYIIREKTQDQASALLQKAVLAPIASVVLCVLKMKGAVNLNGKFPGLAQQINSHVRIGAERDAKMPVERE